MINVSAIGAVLAIAGSMTAILSVVVGVIIRATRAYTRLEMAVLDLREDLNKHVAEERESNAITSAGFGARLDSYAITLSRVDRDVAQLQGRSHGHRPS